MAYGQRVPTAAVTGSGRVATQYGPERSRPAQCRELISHSIVRASEPRSKRGAVSRTNEVARLLPNRLQFIGDRGAEETCNFAEIQCRANASCINDCIACFPWAAKFRQDRRHEHARHVQAPIAATYGLDLRQRVFQTPASRNALARPMLHQVNP